MYLKLFLDNNLDVILMPPAPHTAVPLDCWSKVAYTCLWNYLDYPSVVIPVGQVQDTDIVDDMSNAKFGPDDEQIYRLCRNRPPRNLIIVDQADTCFRRYRPRTVQVRTNLCSGCRIQA